MKLFEITDLMRSILLALAEPLPDASDPGYDLALAERETAELALANTDIDLQAKLRAYVAVAQELRVEREARELEIERIERTVLARMRAACDRDAKKEAWLMATASHVIDQFDVALPIRYREFTLARRKNPPSVRVLDPEAVPLEYTRVVPETREPDKKKLLAELKEGVVIPGVALAAPSYALVVR